MRERRCPHCGIECYFFDGFYYCAHCGLVGSNENPQSHWDSHDKYKKYPDYVG